MSKWREIRFTKGWIVIVASAIGLSYGGYTFINHAITTQIYVTTCGHLDYKPTVILKFCADAEVGIGQIQWSTWSAEGASGTGVYEVNDCAPSCASGKFHYADVRITLSKSKTSDGKIALTFISISTKDEKNLPLSQSTSDSWPLELAG